MKNLYVTDLKEGLSLFGEDFAVKSIKKMTTKQNKPYLDMELSDKTGNIRAKIWPDSLERCEQINEGEIARIDGLIEEFNGLQVKIVSLRKIEDFDPITFVPVSEYENKEMIDKIEKTISSINNKYLKELLKNVFTKNFLKEFSESYAAVHIHHAYQGGLIEHIVEMISMSESILKRYPKMNTDLLKTGILLHDIGKTVEYESKLTVSRTTRGKLLGHIFIGSSYVIEKAPKGIPESLLDEVLHLILSHHGELQFGSPILPITAEAIALSSLDRTSAFLNSAYRAIHALDKNEEFTPYLKHLGAEFYRSPYLDNLTNEDVPF